MTAGIGLGVLALLQLLVAWLSDRSLDKVDRPLFKNQVSSYPALGIKAWFEESTGDMRMEEVLRLARMASATRATITSLVVSFVSLVGTLILVAIAHPEPRLRDARMGATGLLAAVVFIAMFVLWGKLANGSLRARATKHDEMKPGGTAPKAPVPRYWARLRSPETLSRYLTIAFAGAVVAIVASVGI